MSNPIGGLFASALSGASSLDPGAFVYDVTKYGAVAGSQTSGSMLDDAMNKIRAAIPSGQSSVIHIPSGTWYMNGPFVAPQGNITIRGEGRGATSVNMLNTTHCFVLNMPADYGSLARQSDHWPDLYANTGATFGMDSGYVSALGQKYGFRLYSPKQGLANPDFQYIVAPYSGVASGFNGDFWTNTQKFTMEIAINCRIPGAAPGAADIGPNSPPPGFSMGFPNPSNFQMARTWAWSTQGLAGYVVSTTSTVTTIAPDVFSNSSINQGGQGIIATIVSGKGAGQSNIVSSGVQTGSNMQYTFKNAWTTLPDATSYIQFFIGVQLYVNTADDLLDDGRQPGVYDATSLGTVRNIAFNVPSNLTLPANGTWRFVTQVDLTATTDANFAQCWVSVSGSGSSNFLSMPIVATGNTYPLPNPHFVECSGGTFQLGVFTGQLAPGTGTMVSGLAPMGQNVSRVYPCWNATICGFSVSAGGSGGNNYLTTTPLTINPSGPRAGGLINDSGSYNTYGVGNSIAYLPLTDSGSTDPYKSMFLSIYEQTSGTNQAFLFPMRNPVNPIGGPSTIKDLSINGRNQAGCGIIIGSNYGTTVENIGGGGFYSSIGTITINDSYPVYLRNLSFKYAADSHIRLDGSISYFENLVLQFARCAIRLASGSMMGSNIFISPSTNTYHQVRVHSHDGFAIDWRNFFCDDEYLYGMCKYAIIDLDSGNGFSPTSVVIRNYVGADVDFGAPNIKLRAIQGFNNQATFVLDSFNVANIGSPMIGIQGELGASSSQWVGEIKNATPRTFPQDFDLQYVLVDNSGRKSSNIVAIQPLPSVPSTGSWLAGSARIPVTADGLVDGMPLEFVCKTGGKYGSPSGAPVWRASSYNNVDGQGNAMWASTFREDYVSATISGA